MENIPNAIPTSEVGSDAHLVISQEQWRSLLDAQKENTLQLINAMKAAQPVKNNANVTLPKFDPEKFGAEPLAWCAAVDMCMGENPLEGSNLIITLSKALEGSASQWLPEICFSGITWSQFKDLFIERFEGAETPAAKLTAILNSKPKEGECLSIYGTRLMNSLMTRWKSMTTEEIAIATVLTHMAKFDGRLQRTLFTTKITTRTQLQQELKAFSYGKRKIPELSTEIDSKKPKVISVRCHRCGKLGHKIADCRFKRQERNGSDTRISTNLNHKDSVTCFKCGEVGHISTRCTNHEARASTSSGKKEANVKRVNMCHISGPTGTLIHSGEMYHFYFDSGADCSLMVEKVASKFHGKRFDKVITLKGIGNATVFSTIQIRAEVIINGILIEILFHVIPDTYLNCNIMIGREILSQGFNVVMTNDRVDLFTSLSVSACVAKVNSDKFDLNEIETDVTGKDRSLLISVLSEFSDYFIKQIPRTRVSTGKLKIRLVDSNKTVQRRAYRLSPDEKQIVRDRIDELLEAGVIRPSCSPFSSPMLLVKKKDGSHRLCVDYRELNANTVSDKFPLPLISEQIARLSGSKYFTCLDMASGFHQIPVHEDSIERTAFVTPEGQYEWLAMPFGLKNALAVFQRAVINALGDLAYSYVVVYMDDIMILGTTVDESIARMRTVLERFTKAGFSFNKKKCSFLKSTVQYLGYEVSNGEVRPNARKIQALTSLPPPQTVTQLRQFIGLSSYFRKFIPKFSQMMKSLYQMTSCKKDFQWKPEHESSRKQVISLLTNEPVLMIFDPQYPIELYTDASADGYGAILIQKVDSLPRVVEYFSKGTSNTESKYHSYELETLAVVNAIKHFRHYLQGRRFTVFTDCNSLKSSRNKLDLTPRVHRWWAFLQAYDFDIEYREGKRMAHADFFSRNQVPINQNRPERSHSRVVEKRVNLAKISSNWLLAEQRKDGELVALVSKIQNNELPETIAKTYEIRTGIVHRKIQRNGRSRCLPIIPRAFRWSVINQVHESIMHLGWDKTLDKVYEHYWFEHMTKYVHKFVDNCITCKLSKSSTGKIQSELHPIPKVAIPWHTIHMDITGKLSGKSDLKEYVIVAVDAFTKYTLLYHTLKIDSSSCIKAIKFAISLFGVPVRIIADQGRCFSSKEFREFCSLQSIKLHLVATGTSRANGQVERVMSTLKNMMTAIETSDRSWQDALEDIQLALNCTIHRSIKATPLELLVGRVARPLGLVVDSVDNDNLTCNIEELRNRAVKAMQNVADYDKLRFDRARAKIIRHKVGDFVLLKNEERHQTKLDPKFKGPFLITEVLEGDRYTLKSLSNNRTYKYAHESLRKMPESNIPMEFENVERDVSGENVERDVSGENVERDVSVENVERDVSEENVERDVNDLPLGDETVGRVRKVAEVRVGISRCRLRKLRDSGRCYRCWGVGNKASACEGVDRARLCAGRVKEGHRAVECKNSRYCPLCDAEGHSAGGPNCGGGAKRAPKSVPLRATKEKGDRSPSPPKKGAGEKVPKKGEKSDSPPSGGGQDQTKKEADCGQKSGPPPSGGGQDPTKTGGNRSPSLPNGGGWEKDPKKGEKKKLPTFPPWEEGRKRGERRVRVRIRGLSLLWGEGGIAVRTRRATPHPPLRRGWRPRSRTAPANEDRPAERRTNQINLDRKRLATTLLSQVIKERGIDVVLGQEPNKTKRNEIRDWCDDAFIWPADHVRVESIHKGRDFVAVGLGWITLISAYFSPNRRADDFVAFLSMLEEPNDVPRVTTEEIRQAVGSLKSRKAPGLDGLPNEVLKLYLGAAPQGMASCVNSILTSGEYPKVWKRTRLVLVEKPKRDPGADVSYRPICLVDGLGKVAEKVVKTRLLNDANAFGMLSASGHENSGGD
ncbi:uncharacterized protein [Euwallacea fornicatus]|uniref:uncharacterized protein n=1 Tax=Euwallacea fornicatus TaxID=995702 RepID=UPI00338E44E1